jgi:hydrogenase maturation protein HypF
MQSLESSWLDAAGYAGFVIRASRTSGGRTALVLPDIATCPDCLREIFDPDNRRYGHPFTNCTNCGPRFSIIEALPYDRANTSMKLFKMCPACQAEYDNPRDRRFHAQPNACPVCGPHLELWQSGADAPPARGRRAAGPGFSSPRDHGALLAAAQAIRCGQIVAVKGLGGFHLIVAAHVGQAVRRLRERKQREEKPLALMFPSLASVKTVCEVSSLEERLLRSPEAPIVLLEKIVNRKSQIANAVAPGNPNLGVMLPSNPLHHLLMAELGFPVVATSGNLSDEPICTDEYEARERLRAIADVFLVHNRPVVRHVDDSIVRVMLGREMILRRARGFAPLPITLNSQLSTLNAQPVLAVGAHLKNSVALAVGDQVFISQHIGDLETEQAHNAFRRVVGDLQQLYDAKPEIIAADLHPDYLSTRFAKAMGSARVWSAGEVSRRADSVADFSRKEVGLNEVSGATPETARETRALPESEIRHIGVQHHVAHVLSCLAENQLEPPVLGVAWDGTGYGLDGTIWGGEFFRVTDEAIERFAHLRAFRLPGSDAAVKEPRRAALGLLHQLSSRNDNLLSHMRQKVADHFSALEWSALHSMLDRKINAPLCSSVGRLFDAVASLIGLRQRLRFEGQAAMELEFALAGVQTDEVYPLPIVTRHPALILDWSPMIEAMMTDVVRGVSVGEISARFHNALAEAIVGVARQAGETRIVLSGGCFQNRYLTERTVSRLRDEDFQPYWHQRVPPNDGGLALGQVIGALRAARRSGNPQPATS